MQSFTCNKGHDHTSVEMATTCDNVRARDRTISDIAIEIQKTWPNVNFAARPYLQAMKYISNLSDYYGQDDARGIVLYFLSNATAWRGDDARRIKAELKSMLSRKG